MSQTWKTPDEVLKLQRFKLKKKALQARLVHKKEERKTDQRDLLEIVYSQKRKNPFAKQTDQTDKKLKLNQQSSHLSTDDALYELLNPTTNAISTEDSDQKPKIKLGLQPFDSKSFANIFNEANCPDENENDNQKSGDYLPIDWSLKSRMRILCESALPGTNLKTNQEASGITGFVRCVDRINNTTNNLDISLGARFHQCTHYWQHPYLPWLTLFPRNSKSNIGFQIGDRERENLIRDWTDSFRGLFQLLRARHCPYFYFCANTFTVLFRAAGIGGRAETHALMSPTSRGIRSALKQEEIEYSMPFKRDNNLNRSKEENLSNSTEDKNKPKEELFINNEEDNDEDDEEEEEKWLESLGVDEKEIRKISTSRVREKIHKEITDDFSDNSLILIEGVECQAFFNFLLNAKSTITSVGRLAGIPPTLLAPVCFPKATMQTLTTRSCKVRNDGTEYFSIEMKGIILPNVLPYINTLLRETKDAFSVTLASNSNTLAFSKASKKLIEEVKNENTTSDQVFGKENLSDCGLQADVIDAMCSTKKDAVSIMDRMCFSKEVGFIWS